MCCVMPPASPSATLVSRIEQRSLAVVDVTHDRNHRRSRRDLDCRLFPTARGSGVNVFRSLLFERDHIRFSAEEARHFAGQLGVERLVHRRENSASQQARNHILHTNTKLLRQIFYADAFRDRDVARDRHRLIRHHHARRRRVALHRAFFYTTWNIPLARPPRRSSRTSPRPSWSRRRKPWTNTQRTRTSRSRTRGMHGTSFTRTQRTRRPTARRHRTRALENWLSRHRTPRRRTHGPRGR